MCWIERSSSRKIRLSACSICHIRIHFGCAGNIALFFSDLNCAYFVLIMKVCYNDRIKSVYSSLSLCATVFLFVELFFKSLFSSSFFLSIITLCCFSLSHKVDISRLKFLFVQATFFSTVDNVFFTSLLWLLRQLHT